MSQGLNLEEAQAFLKAYAQNTKPMAVLTKKPLPRTNSIRYQLLIYDKGARVSVPLYLTQAATSITTPKLQGPQVALQATSFTIQVLIIRSALSEESWRAYVTQAVDVKSKKRKKTGQGLVEPGAVRKWCAR